MKTENLRNHKDILQESKLHNTLKDELTTKDIYLIRIPIVAYVNEAMTH